MHFTGGLITVHKFGEVGPAFWPCTLHNYLGKEMLADQNPSQSSETSLWALRKYHHSHDGSQKLVIVTKTTSYEINEASKGPSTMRKTSSSKDHFQHV